MLCASAFNCTHPFPHPSQLIKILTWWPSFVRANEEAFPLGTALFGFLLIQFQIQIDWSRNNPDMILISLSITYWSDPHDRLADLSTRVEMEETIGSRRRDNAENDAINMARGPKRSKENNRYPCPKCRKLLSSPSCVNRHVASIHNGSKAYECCVCGKHFSAWSDLKSHQQRKH